MKFPFWKKQSLSKLNGLAIARPMLSKTRTPSVVETSMTSPISGKYPFVIPVNPGKSPNPLLSADMNGFVNGFLKGVRDP